MVGDSDLETQLVVSNPTFSPLTFTVYEIATRTDGTVRPEGGLVLEEIEVAPGSTMILTGLTDSMDGSMLEITADSDLVIGARLVGDMDGEEVLGARVPVVSSGNAIPGGVMHHVQGWRNDPDSHTAFGIFNLSQSANPCVIDVLAASGAPLIPRTLITLEPLSHTYFDDVLGLIGIDDALDVRAQIDCDRSSYSYAIVQTASGDLKLIEPSQTGSSLFTAPGAEEPCPDGGVCFDLPTFVPSPGNDIFVTDLEGLDPSAIYDRVRVSFDFLHGGWHPVSDGLHGLFWLYRNGTWRGNTFGYVNFRGPNRNLVSQLSNVGLPAGETRRSTQSIVLQPGQLYHVEYEYNGPARVMRTVVTDAVGNVLADMTETTPTNRVPVQDGFTIQIALHREFIEVPTFGWVYSNGRVIFD
ncbi:MAG: hypothetical protein DWQ36_12415 [Acidobacteria bacterium]|nr:MAG: hypothetical protein DWQ30_24810 [Acidobacteriota bacterium]REK07341.1 MAG: hypothetical protein DWQ36_12415 [Acidobacteriota bacterium]